MEPTLATDSTLVASEKTRLLSALVGGQGAMPHFSRGIRKTGVDYSRKRAAVIRLPHIDMVDPRESVSLGDRLVIRRTRDLRRFT